MRQNEVLVRGDCAIALSSRSPASSLQFECDLREQAQNLDPKLNGHRVLRAQVLSSGSLGQRAVMLQNDATQLFHTHGASAEYASGKRSLFSGK